MISPSQPSWIADAVFYQVFVDRFAVGRIAADIHALGGRDDHRIDRDMLSRWANHTSGAFTLAEFDGGHFYVNEYTHDVAELVNEL